MPCGTKKPKPKTKAPAKTRTLESFAKHKVSLSKSTEDKLRRVYSLRKRAKVYDHRAKRYRYLEDTKEAITKKGTSFRKVSGPSLSKGTEDRLKDAYAKRKKAQRAKTKTKKASHAPKSQGPSYVAVDTSSIKYGDTGWVHVQVASLLTKTPQNIHELSSKAIDVASGRVGHPVRDSSVSHRIVKCLTYLTKQGVANREKIGAFVYYSLAEKKR